MPALRTTQIHHTYQSTTPSHVQKKEKRWRRVLVTARHSHSTTPISQSRPFPPSTNGHPNTPSPPAAIPPTKGVLHQADFPCSAGRSAAWKMGASAAAKIYSAKGNAPYIGEKCSSIKIFHGELFYTKFQLGASGPRQGSTQRPAMRKQSHAKCITDITQTHPHTTRHISYPRANQKKKQEWETSFFRKSLTHPHTPCAHLVACNGQ